MELKLENVKKDFKRHEVLKGINLNLQDNHIYGITGDNGSGKSVLLKIIAGLYKASSGTITYNNLVLKKDIDFLPSLGLIIEKPGFFNDLSAFDNLKILASINQKVSDTEINDVINLVGLDNSKQPVKQYSLGMRQRLGIAQAIMEQPNVLILDEFSTGLDTKGIDLAHNIILKYKSAGRIIILTSHSKYDIEALCDTVYHLEEGELHEQKR